MLWQVPPISNFCEHVETLWLDQGSLVWHREYKKKVPSISQRLKSDLDMPRNENRPNYVRHIISSTELGVVLIGALKVMQHRDPKNGTHVWLYQNVLSLQRSGTGTAGREQCPQQEFPMDLSM